MLFDEFLSARTKTMMKLISLKILMIKFFCKEGKEVGLRLIRPVVLVPPGFMDQ